MTEEKKTLKEQISELYDRDCYGYMRVVRPEEIFKIVDGLIAELQKELHWTERCFTNESEQWIKGYKKAIKTFLVLLGVETKDRKLIDAKEFEEN